MNTIKLLFCTTNGPISWAIKVVTWSTWSHVAFIDGDDVIEAVSIHGVRRYPLAKRLTEVSKYAIVELSCDNPEAVLAAAALQIGKPYDYTGVLGIGFHRDWTATNSWWCSELVAWAIATGDKPQWRTDALRRITPEHEWMLAPAN